MFEKQVKKRYFRKLMEEEQRKRKCPAVKWMKRFGIAGFLFFLIKRLLWLIIPVLVGYVAYTN